MLEPDAACALLRIDLARLKNTSKELLDALLDLRPERIPALFERATGHRQDTRRGQPQA
jgi:hypothetical protein